MSGERLDEQTIGSDAQRVSGALEMWKGDVNVRVSGSTELEDAAARALVTLNGGGPAGADEDFPRVEDDCSDYALEPYFGD